MVEKINNLKNCSGSEMQRVIKEIKIANKKINFFSRDVYPYSYPVKVGELIKNAEDFEQYSRSSQNVIYDEIKGLVVIINTWIEYYNEPKVKVKIIKGYNQGKVLEVEEKMAKYLVEQKTVEII